MSGVEEEDARAKLFDARVLLLKGEIDDAAANRICADLLQMEADDPTSDVYLYIDSPGGLVTPGMALYDVIKYVRMDVVTVAFGMAAGMAQVVLSAGTPGKRTALPEARILLIPPKGPAGDADAAVGDRIFQIIAEDTGLPLGQVVADANRERWFTAQEALENGLVDRVLSASPPMTGPLPDTGARRPDPEEPVPAGVDHGRRAQALGTAVEHVVLRRYPGVTAASHPADHRRLRADLVEALLKAVPEWLEVDAAYTGRDDAAQAAVRLRSWLETVPEPDERPARPSARLALDGVLHEVADRIGDLPLLGNGDRRLGYEAGLRAARRGVLQRAEPAAGTAGAPAEPALPPGLSLDRPRPGPAPVPLPDHPEQVERFARVLRARLAGLPGGERKEVAGRLLETAHAPDPDVYARVHRQWILNEDVVADLEERMRARTGLTPGEAHRRQEIVRELDDLAASLTPVGTATGSFPAAFETATRRAIAILRSTADEIRPPWAP
ncbi:ATP-dependent Clp protease proteolytic subunit [Actinomadura madurae]|uniref:ClpP family protease n=1 Tax=Actinomadura madurae TaxID=1993 RepID=UPI00399AE22D